MMSICNKQHLSNMPGSIFWKIKQHLGGWVEKKTLLIKKSV